MEKVLENIIDAIGDNNCLSTIVSEPGSGGTSWMYTLAKHFSLKKDKKILLFVNAYENSQRLCSFKADEFKNRVQVVKVKEDKEIIKRLCSFKADEFKNRDHYDYDCVLIDSMDEIAMQEDNYPGLGYRSKGQSELIKVLTALEKPVVIGVRNNRTLRWSNSSRDQSLNYRSGNVLLLNRKSNETAIQGRMELYKSRFIFNKELAFDYELDEFIDLEKVKLIKNKVFNKEVQGNCHLKLISSFDSWKDKSLSDYLPNIGSKQLQRLSDLVFLPDGNVNAFVLNVIEFLKVTYPEEFNIDDIIYQSSFEENHVECSHLDSIRSFSLKTHVSPFFKDCVSYRRMLTLIKNYIKDTEYRKNGFKIFFSIGFIYLDGVALREAFLDSNRKEFVQIVDKIFNKKRLQKKNLVEICADLNQHEQTLSNLKDTHKTQIVEVRQKRFKLNNANLGIEVPENIDEIIKGSLRFKNCTGGSSFLMRLSSEESYLFYLKGKEDYCVHINSDKKIIEVKGISNTHVNAKEQEFVRNVVNKLII